MPTFTAAVVQLKQRHRCCNQYRGDGGPVFVLPLLKALNMFKRLK